MYDSHNHTNPGSSPLTRGKRLSRQISAPRQRLIPAHAGKTVVVCLPPSAVAAHPRSRGENGGSGPGCADPYGSSPLTRGKLVRALSGVYDRRLIPAHAGKTSPRNSARRTSKAHPRSRGENDAVPHVRACAPGSSPLTRGKPKPVTGSWAAVGLIPAHAGKTRRARKAWSIDPAHPRSRGENPSWTRREALPIGSSPLTRGKPYLSVFNDRVSGLIPAHAGKTPRLLMRSPSRSAHPRSRGENPPMCLESDCPIGSSPLTRGKPVPIAIILCDRRLIPAHAGKTSNPAS